jgi:hypothetical protein
MSAARYSFLICVNFLEIASFESDADPPHIGETIKLSNDLLSPDFTGTGLDRQDLLVTDVTHIFQDEHRAQVIFDVKFESEKFREIFEMSNKRRRQLGGKK